MTGKADAYPFPTLAAPLRFAIALAAVAIVFGIDYVSGPLIDDGSMFLLLGTAVMASAWFAGTGPALAATVLGALMGAFAARSQTGTDGAVPTHLALFLVQGLLLTAVVSELRAARRSSEQQALVAQAARREGEAANRMKDEFLATVSHELRTPLNAMLGWVHLLRTGKLDPPTSERGLESIERNVRLQAQLTGDLLDVSKALTGQLQLKTRPTTLVEAAQQAISALGSAARAKGVMLDLALPDSPVVILGDQTRLRQIVWHLLANAIKFTPRTGIIRVVVEQSQGEARLIVIDSGQGIDPKFLPRIFERFTQADPSPTRSTGGLGVGLALVRELVELHGGEIEARNDLTGAGAVFTVRFPLQPADLLERAPQKAPGTVRIVASPLLDGVRVLVLDSNLESGEVLRAVLQQRGAMVRTVASVADALESLEAWRPDVLVSDRTSSDQASYALVGKVHSLDAQRGGRIPAFALTTRALSDKRLGGMLADVHSELLKPVEPALLASEIARLTGRERRHAQR